MAEVCNSGNQKLDAAVSQWLKSDKNPVTREEVLEDVKKGRWDKLSKTMLGRQKFGTAGLRGKMAAGYQCMNDVVVLQTAQGLCAYLKKVCNKSQLGSGFVIGYDGRYNSKRFAELTAKVFVSSSIPVRMFFEVCPTPFVSYATILYGTAGGVMVTASHNPKEDNGYKVYWTNGSQIITPHDDNILEEIELNLEIPDEHWDIKDIRSHELVSDCLEDVSTKYYKYISDSLPDHVMTINAKSSIHTVYTAMHGVGYDYIMKAFDAARLRAPHSVREQQEPDPEFPTVRFPNPEEPQCLELSCLLAEREMIRIVLANDPDADRLAVAEYDESDMRDPWKILTGNEMGTLLGWWLLQQQKQLNQPLDEVYLIASVVSSKMLRTIAHAEGCHFVETLTGFKWMGTTALILGKEGKVPLFAFEEAIGYMCNSKVPDKDGISAAVQVASLASMLYSNGSSLRDQLNKLYAQYGYHVSHNAYYICYDPATIQKIFSRIRNYDGPGQYPKIVAGCLIVSVHDLAAGVQIPEVSQNGDHLRCIGTGLDQDYTSGEMVMFRCSNGLSVTVRTSGTEPKIKYYTELVARVRCPGEQPLVKMQLKKMVQEFIEELLLPKENELLG